MGIVKYTMAGLGDVLSGLQYPEGKNLWTAAADGELERIEQLLNQGECKINDQDESGNSAMHAACSYGHTVLLCWMINEGGDVNLLDEDGDTPLHVCESPECADVLIQAGADQNAVNSTGWTALDVAVDDGERPQMVEWLKEHGVNMQEPELTDEALNQLCDLLEADDCTADQEEETAADDAPASTEEKTE